MRFLSPLLLLAVFGLGQRASAQSLTLETLAFGFSSPVAAEAPLGDDRIFVVEQSGQVRIFKNGFVQGTPFLSLAGKVAVGGERGLFDIAFHPEYSTNGTFFVAYTAWSGATTIERYRVSSWDPDQADASTGFVVLSVPQPYENHNGGGIEFGPDGHLYIGLGDGGSAGDPSCNGQDLSSLLGKMLRIDVDPIDFTGTYAIPSDNPFAFTPGARGEIFSLGLRNPWRFSFDRENGNLLIGDVGELQREEISVSPLGAKGRNFGWPVMEGNLCFANTCPTGTLNCFDASLALPVHEYTHDPWTGGCSVIGGYVYRGSAIPSLQGSYFFGDFCSGKVWSLQTDGYTSFGLVDRTSELAGPGGSIPTPTAFGEDGNGELLLVTIGGDLHRIVPTFGGGGPSTARVKFSRGSISSGVQQQILADMGPGFAWQPYIMLGSLSGSSPGFWNGGVFIPLNWDTYFSAALAGETAALTLGELGTLDAQGRAHAGFVAPPTVLPSGVVGQTLHQAFLTFNSFNAALTGASDPVSLSFVF